jgi:hypothetical protein
VVASIATVIIADRKIMVVRIVSHQLLKVRPYPPRLLPSLDYTMVVIDLDTPFLSPYF